MGGAWICPKWARYVYDVFLRSRTEYVAHAKTVCTRPSPRFVGGACVRDYTENKMVLLTRDNGFGFYLLCAQKKPQYANIQKRSCHSSLMHCKFSRLR